VAKLINKYYETDLLRSTFLKVLFEPEIADGPILSDRRNLAIGILINHTAEIRISEVVL